jgi:hypothetical protein
MASCRDSRVMNSVVPAGMDPGSSELTAVALGNFIVTSDGVCHQREG